MYDDFKEINEHVYDLDHDEESFGSLAFEEAKVFEEEGNWQAAIDIYGQFIFTTEWEIDNPFAYYKYANILQTHLENTEASLQICERYLKDYPIKDLYDFERKSPLYYLTIEALFDLGKNNEAAFFFTELKKYDSPENLLLEYVYIKKSKGDEAANHFMNDGLDNAFQTSTANAITYTKELYDEGIYYTVNPFALDKFYIKKDIGPSIDKERNELHMYGVLPICTYGAKMPIAAQYIDASIFAWKNMDEVIKEIIRVVKSETTGQYYYEILQHTDRWYGDYAFIYRHIKYLVPYTEDCHFFIEEDYSNRIDEYIVRQGALHFFVGYAKDEFIDSKEAFIEKRLLELQNCTYTKKYLSFSNLPWSEYNINRGVLEFEDKNAVAKKLAKSIKYDPLNANAWYQKGLYYGLLGQESDAITSFKKATEINDKDIDFLISFVQQLSISNKKSDWSLAIEYLDKGMLLDTKNKKLLYLGKDVYTKLNNQEKINIYDSSLCNFHKKIFSDTAKDFSFSTISSYEKNSYENELRKITDGNYDGCIKKASILYHIEKWKEADAMYSQAMKLNPDADIPYLGKANLCWYIYAPADYKKAIQYCDKALTVNPKSEYTWCTKGSALCNLGEYSEALTCLKKAIKINPRHWQAYYCIACVYALMADAENALEALKQAVALDKSYKAKRKLFYEKDFKNLHNIVQFWQLVDPVLKAY